jgi:hypothetical protein
MTSSPSTSSESLGALRAVAVRPLNGVPEAQIAPPPERPPMTPLAPNGQVVAETHSDSPASAGGSTSPSSTPTMCTGETTPYAPMMAYGIHHGCGTPANPAARSTPTAATKTIAITWRWDSLTRNHPRRCASRPRRTPARPTRTDGAPSAAASRRQYLRHHRSTARTHGQQTCDCTTARSQSTPASAPRCRTVPVEPSPRTCRQPRTRTAPGSCEAASSPPRFPTGGVVAVRIPLRQVPLTKGQKQAEGAENAGTCQNHFHHHQKLRSLTRKGATGNHLSPSPETDSRNPLVPRYQRKLRYRRTSLHYDSGYCSKNVA